MRPRSRAIVPFVHLGVSAGLLLGCASDPAPERLELTAADFAAEDAPVTLGPSARPAATPGSVSPAPAPAAPIELGIVARAGTPEQSQVDPSPIGQEVLVEAKVGDVNGRPIYAQAFLEPLSGRLIADARRKSPAQWRRDASILIGQRLDQLVQDELLRAEALSRLTVEQKQGFRAFVAGLRDELISRSYGSAALAEAALLEERGLTASEYLAQEEATLLIRETLRSEIQQRVQVSWRDIRQRYERDIEKYRPPPIARFRVIRAAGTDAETVAAQLESGTPFATIAEGELNTFGREEAGLVEVELTDGSPRLFGAAPVNELAAKLTPGSWGGPVRLGPSDLWVFFESVEDNSTDLYDAQLTIEDEIFNARFSAEAQRLYEQLTAGAIRRSLDDLRRSLLEVAISRYGPTG